MPSLPETDARRKSERRNPFAGSLNDGGPTPRSSLRVPDVNGLTLLDAALAYAEAGWYVLPTDPAKDIKSPGSVVGGKWNEKSSRDPDQIREWWTDNPDYGIALHCGRSGAGVFDYDMNNLAALRVIGRTDLADALAAADTVQGSRLDGDRGHYIFLQPAEDTESGPKPTPPRPQEGQGLGRAKLTDDDVRAVRADFAAGKWNRKELAYIYDVSVPAINSLLRGESYAHVTAEPTPQEQES